MHRRSIYNIAVFLFDFIVIATVNAIEMETYNFSARFTWTIHSCDRFRCARRQAKLWQKWNEENEEEENNHMERLKWFNPFENLQNPRKM